LITIIVSEFSEILLLKTDIFKWFESTGIKQCTVHVPQECSINAVLLSEHYFTSLQLLSLQRYRKHGVIYSLASPLMQLLWCQKAFHQVYLPLLLQSLLTPLIPSQGLFQCDTSKRFHVTFNPMSCSW